jgi:hypothetical protein
MRVVFHNDAGSNPETSVFMMDYAMGIGAMTESALLTIGPLVYKNFGFQRLLASQIFH